MDQGPERGAPSIVSTCLDRVTANPPMPIAILLFLSLLWALAPAGARAQDVTAGAPAPAALGAAIDLGAADGHSDARLERRPVQARRLLQRFYAGAGHRLVWDHADRALARTALHLLEAAAEHGLLAADYRVASSLPDADATAEQLARFDVDLSRALLQFLADLHGGRVAPDFSLFINGLAPRRIDPAALLQQALHAGRLDRAVSAAEPPIAPYARVRRSLLEYRRLARAHPALAPLPPLPQGAAELRRRLVLLGDLAADAPSENALQQALRRFQLRHGLSEDGVAGAATMAALAVPLEQRVRQLELTLERLRWIPALPPGPLIVVNVPAFRLWAFDTRSSLADQNDIQPDSQPLAPQLEMRVIVGRAVRTPTPLFIGQLRHLEFNPYWNVPRSIELGEIVPKLARDPDYLRKHDMELVARGGALAGQESGLAALRAGTVRVRQRPGARNVLGAVKFAMPNPMNIFLHSTAARELFGKNRRDLSHGCIRLEKPDELAEFVLRGQDGWDRSSVQAALQPGPTRTVRLAAPIPVILSYATAVADREGRTLFAEDIYGRDRKLARALGLPDVGTPLME